MRYVHNIRVTRKKTHTLKISLLITIFIICLIAILGFTSVNATSFFVGFTQSLIRVVIAYFISLILASILVVIISTSKKVETISLPILDLLQSFPSFALFPILLIWFGKTSIVTILILVVSMIWPILFSLLSAQKQIRLDLVEAAKIFGARKRKFLRFVFFPLLFPSVITGSIVAWGEAWETIIAAEIIVGVSGVGTYLAQSGESEQTNILVIGILMLMLLLFLLNKYIWLPLLDSSTKYQQE